MSTSALIEIKYCDGNTHSLLRIVRDAYFEQLVEKIAIFLAELDNDGDRDRLNWDFLVTMMLGKLIGDYSKIALVAPCDIDQAKKDRYFNHKIVLMPDPESYNSKKNHINDAIRIDARNSEGVIYNTTLTIAAADAKVKRKSKKN